MQSNVLLPVCMHSCKVHSSLVPPEDAKVMPAQVSPGNVEKQKADCSPTTPDFPLHTNGPVNLHGKSPVQATDFIQPTLHFIQQAGARYLIGLLRFSYVLPTT